MDRSLLGGKGVSSISQVKYPSLKERFEKKTAPSFYHDLPIMLLTFECQQCMKYGTIVAGFVSAFQ